MDAPATNLILMGTGPFAVPSFEALRAAGYPISLVVTRPQPAIKSRTGSPPSPVRDWANEHGLPIFDPISINQPDAVKRLQQINADLLVVCDYGQILKPPALESARLGGINLHGSLLPKYRGAAPVQWALLSGDAATGVSVIHMTPRLDAGPLLTSRQTAIGDHETAGQLEARLAQIGVDATLEAAEMLMRWDGASSIGQPQPTELASHAPRLKKSDGLIDWNRRWREIDCHVRGMQPWPVAFTHLAVSEGKPPLRIAVKQIAVTETAAAGAIPGQIIAGDDKQGLMVATADRVIRIERLQVAGKKETSGVEFLRGHQPRTEAKLF